MSAHPLLPARAPAALPSSADGVLLLAATSRNLGAMIAVGAFRADLSYRLNVLPIRLPALRRQLCTAGEAAPPVAMRKPLPQAIAELKARAIRDALAASRLLGISRATLYEKLRLLGALA